MRSQVHEDGNVEIIAIGERQEFAISFQTDALRAFVDMACQALGESDTRCAQTR